MPLIVENLTVGRGDRIVLRGLSLEARPGEAVLLTGPNGAGKTTLLRTIAGFLAPSEGSIRLAAGDGSAGPPPDLAAPPVGPDDEIAALGERCHFVGHLNGIKAALTVLENARFWAAYLGAGVQDVSPALEHFRLADLGPVRAGYLSAGQKRRLGLSRLLLAARPLWLLDEPAVSLDATSQSLLAEAVNAHLAAGGLVLAATHQPLGFSPSREVRLGTARQAA